MSATHAAVVLFGHGTVDDLADLQPFVTNIRRGHPPSPELLAELRHRYEAIGGRSPFTDIARRLAARVEVELGVPVAVAMRLWKPFAKDVLRGLGETRGVTHAVFVPLAQHSGGVYGDAAVQAAADLAKEGGPTVAVLAAKNWGLEPSLSDAFAASLREALARVPAADRPATRVLFTAHSLPVSILAAGDPYQREVEASAAAVAGRVGLVDHAVAFQSQGPRVGPGGRPIEWVGPDLPMALDAAKAAGVRHVVFAPIGFLADHVEILYDLDVEAKAWAAERGLTVSRTESLNDGVALARVIADVARPLLAGAAPEVS